MSDRVLIPLPGFGVLELSRETFEQHIVRQAVSDAAQRADEPMLDADEAAKRLSVSARWLEDSARAGIIPHYKLGRFIRFRVSDLAAHCRVDGAAIPGTRLATDSESVGNVRRFSRQ